LKTAGHADVIDMSTVLAGRMFEHGTSFFYSPR